MATVHFIQQGKGGVGKSVIASFLYQVLHHQGKEVAAFDTDPVNATLKGYKEFKVIQVDIVRQGQVDARAFDELLEGLYSLPENSHAIVDNGASSFLALGNYMKDIGLIQILEEKGHQVFFHSVVTGGQASLFPSRKISVRAGVSERRHFPASSPSWSRNARPYALHQPSPRN